MSQPSVLPINPDHVRQQFTRRSPLDAAQFLYGEIAQRLLQRLSYIRLQPNHILDAGCGAAHALEPLRSRYTEAAYTGLDACETLLNVAQQRHAKRPGLWQKLRKVAAPKPEFVLGDLAKSSISPSSIDLVWSNLALHWHPEPHKVFEEWYRLLRSGGLAMFSAFGPASLQELRQALTDAKIETQTLQFVDMHDFGDLLLERGFTDPVMDQETITLTYRHAEKLLADVWNLGGNPSTRRRPGLVGKKWRQRLLAALESQRQLDGNIHLTLEVAYGHAWRAAQVRKASGEIRISIDSIGRAPKRDDN